MNEVQEQKYADRVAGNIRGFLSATNSADYSAEYIARCMLDSLGELELPIDLVWQMARTPFLGGADGWAERNHKAFWDVLEHMDCPEHPGIVHATHANTPASDGPY